MFFFYLLGLNNFELLEEVSTPKMPRLTLKYSIPYTDIYKPLEVFGDVDTLTRIFVFDAVFLQPRTVRPLALQFGCVTLVGDRVPQPKPAVLGSGDFPQVFSIKKATSETKPPLNSPPHFKCYF